MAAGDALELVLFATEAPLIRRALAAGISTIIVDWEWRGKKQRQETWDTEINRDTVDDLLRLAACEVPSRLCRLNRQGQWTADEVEEAVAASATQLLLPMVDTPAEVESVLDLVDGRCGLGILVETEIGISNAKDLARLPLASVYVGLNDLAISRGSASIFDAVADGPVEKLRRVFSETHFGFGGVTVADGGAPVPCRLLLGEMARLDCTFSFLRRSFKRDVAGRDLVREVTRIRELWRELLDRSPDEVARDRERLCSAIRSIPALAER